MNLNVIIHGEMKLPTKQPGSLRSDVGNVLGLTHEQWLIEII